MTTSWKKWAMAGWICAIAAMAAAHCLHLRADFPNHSPWWDDWAKYTDEGWYGNAAVRAHLLGSWYVKGDFNPAAAVPVWPFLEWLLFFVTGVRIEAARGLAIFFFLLELGLGYMLLRAHGSRWMALLGVTLVVTSPFIYSFSRLAILEPMLLAFFLAALNLAVRVGRWRRPLTASACVGVLFTLMLLTKTTAVFLLPALGWAMVSAAGRDGAKAVRCALVAVITSAATFGAWMVLVAERGLLGDYTYLFYVNTYPKPKELYWPLASLWWAVHGGMWPDKILMPLAAAVVVAALIAAGKPWRLLREPVFGACLLAVAGYILFMTYQNHPQPRYYTVVALFAFFLAAKAVEALLKGAARAPAGAKAGMLGARAGGWRWMAGAMALIASIAAVARNTAWTLEYVAHPEYTWVTAATNLTRYIDEHPNGNRLLVSLSGDEIMMIAHLPSLCDDFGTTALPDKLAEYQPGWWATWNDIDPGTLEDLHIHFSLEQVAMFRAFDHPERTRLVLFKLHPLPAGMAREPGPALQVPLAGDKIEIPVQ